MQIVALHGFLGKPSDWDFCNIQSAPSLEEMPVIPFNELAKKINATSAPSSIIMGYSLGARLALHCCLENPKKWEAAILISANLGLHSEKERTLRLQRDEEWALRFRNDEWSTLMDDWNAQPALKSSGKLSRIESYYNRHKLSEMLTTWSLGHQDDLTIPLQSLPLPLLWIVGERDISYVQHAQKLTFLHPLSQVVVVPDVGHRVPWDASSTFINCVDTFRSKLCKQLQHG